VHEVFDAVNWIKRNIMGKVNRMFMPYDSRSMKRYSTEEIRAQVRQIYGVELINGIEEPLIGCSNCESMQYPIASFKNIPMAWRVTREGGKFFRWRTSPVPSDFSMEYAVFFFPMATGYGKAYPEPSGAFCFYVNGEPAIYFCETKYSQKWSQKGYEFYYDVMRYHVVPEGIGLNLDPYIQGDRMASFGIGFLKIPRAKLKPGMPVELEVRTLEYFPSHTWVRIDLPHEFYQLKNVFYLMNWEQGLECLMSKAIPEKINDKNVYAGDIHAHSFCGVVSPCDQLRQPNQPKDCVNCNLVGRGRGKGWQEGNGCGYGTIHNNYLYARDIANLDFFCLTDHDFQMDDSDWQEHIRTANYFNRSGEFVTINGYEYTSFWYGHRNVYFAKDGPLNIVRAVPYGEGYGNYHENPPEYMWEVLKQTGEDFITIPHHATAADHPLCWDWFNPEYDKMVEIFSGWGNSEDFRGPLIGNGSNKYKHLTALRALQRGYKFGFVASSDCHDGCPGNAQGAQIFNWANKYSETGSGKVICLCDNLTREEVFYALKQRKAYATTGAKILADFRINDCGIGAELSASGTREVYLDVRAPGSIAKVQIIKNGNILLREFCDTTQETFKLIDDKAERDIDFYYARIQLHDREMAWITPIWVKR